MATYQQFKHVADGIGAVPAIPGIAARKIHRNNVPAATPNDYYRRALAIPLLDTLITELDFWFNKVSICASKLLYLFLQFYVVVHLTVSWTM